MVEKTGKEEVAGRRDFLKLASVGTALGGAAMVVGKPVTADAAELEAGSGYRKSEHVKAYYNSAKF